MVRISLMALALLLAASPAQAQKAAPEKETPPVVLNRAEVQRAIVQNYPRDLLRDGIGGVVHVSFVIELDSTASAIEVHESSGQRGLDTTAVSLARMLRFRPATVNHQPVRVRVVVPLNFDPGRPQGGRRRRFLGIF